MDDHAVWYLMGSVWLALQCISAAGRPRGAGEWLGLVGISAIWPATLAFLIYNTLKRRWGKP